MSSLRHGGPLHAEEGSVGERGRAGAAPVRGGAGATPGGSRSAEVPATVAGTLRLAAGIPEGRRPLLVRRPARLDAQLARYRADQVDLELSVVDRGARGRRLPLECSIAGRPRLVASSADGDPDVAVGRVQEGMRRQLDDTATRRGPRNDRLLRRSTRTGRRTAVPDRDGAPVDAPRAAPSPGADR